MIESRFHLSKDSRLVRLSIVSEINRPDLRYGLPVSDPTTMFRVTVELVTRGPEPEGFPPTWRLLKLVGPDPSWQRMQEALLTIFRLYQADGWSQVEYD